MFWFLIVKHGTVLIGSLFFAFQAVLIHDPQAAEKLDKWFTYIARWVVVELLWIFKPIRVGRQGSESRFDSIQIMSMLTVFLFYRTFVGSALGASSSLYPTLAWNKYEETMIGAPRTNNTCEGTCLKYWVFFLFVSTFWDLTNTKCVWKNSFTYNLVDFGNLNNFLKFIWRKFFKKK